MFNFEKINSIKILKSDIFNEYFIHAFSTRTGGNTLEPLNSFSMSTAGVEGLDSEIQKNRQKICEVLGLDYSKLLIPDQKHTDNIAVIRDFSEKINLSETDGVITNLVDVPVMLLFADCVPVILYSPKYKVMGIIHAGWRGTAKGIVKKAVDIFKNEFGVDPFDIRAAIGPAIGQCCYPVSHEVAEQLNMSINGNYDNIFSEENDKVRVDLKALNACQLEECGVDKVDVTELCTSCNNDIFYSYRADNGKTGRHCAIAAMKR